VQPEKNNWKKLSLPFGTELHEALQLQHHAAQFIALAGRHLLPQVPDDSNTNMEFIPGKNLLAGNPLSNGTRLALDMNNLTLCLPDKNLDFTDILSLAGKTRLQIFREVKEHLSNAGIDTSLLKDELHYTIPQHAVDKGATFILPDKIYFQENTAYRYNAAFILQKIASRYPDVPPVRIWPHHFDTGTFIPVKKNREGNVSVSFGIGLAIPDTIVNEPYFYLSFWSESSAPDMKTLPSPEAGEWITTGWSGGILRLSEILRQTSAGTQAGVADSFFRSGLEILSEIIISP